MNLEQLRARLAEINARCQAIQASADEATRDLTAEETQEVEDLMVEFDEVTANIARRERMQAMGERMSQPSARRTSPEQTDESTLSSISAAARGQEPAQRGGPPNNGLRMTRLTTLEERQRWGFENFGVYLNAVHRASLGRGMDPRLLAAAASTVSTEAVGADGGFAMPPEWRSEIMQLVEGEDSMLGYCDQQPVSGPSITFPTDETTDWDTSTGVQCYWDGEADQINQSKITRLKELTVKLHRLTALVPVTDELLADAPAMASYVTRKAGARLMFKVNDAVMNGTGVGMPLGMLKSAALVSVAKESSQVADTIHAKNVIKMAARMPASGYKRSRWFINQDVWSEIMGMGNVVTNAAGTVAGGAGALWMPPTGMANSGPFGSLLGRPITVTETCAALGDQGDILLADMAMYLAVIRSGGLRSDVSIHLWFDQSLTAFRFILRLNGQPWLSKPISRKASGANTLSAFVTLDARG